MKFEFMEVRWSFIVLALMVILIAISLWHAHKRKDLEFSLFDLIMEGGRVSKIAFAFMTVLAMTTWVIIHLTVSGRLTEGYLGLYLTAWVTPLIARVVFNKQDAPIPSSGKVEAVLIDESPK